MSVNESIADVESLCFEYPRTRALSSVSFSVPRATVTALVGPNGAGKSTLLRCLSALEMPFSGKVRIAGIDTEVSPREVHRQVGYLSDFFGLYEDLTARKCLLHAAAMHGMPTHLAASKIEQLSEQLNLGALLDKRAGGLSRGQKQRVAIAQAIIHDPPLLLLDEPAAGLDPEARHSLSTLINGLRQRGLTIIVSSHILSELEDYSTHMLTLEQGRVLGFQSLKESSPELPQHFECRIVSSMEDARNFFSRQANVSVISVSGESMTISLPGDSKVVADLLGAAINEGVRLYSFVKIERSMQEVYLRQLKEERSSES